MKRIIILVIMSLAFMTTTAQAVEQTAFSGAGVIESTVGGFKFPNKTVQSTASPDLSAQVAELQALVATLQSELADTQNEEVLEIDCGVSESLSPVQDALALLNPFDRAYIIRVAGVCDEILLIEDFTNITIQRLDGTPTFGRVEVLDSGYVTFNGIDFVGPYTTPYAGQPAIKFTSNGQLVMIGAEVSCPVPNGKDTGDCIDAVAINGPGKVRLQDFDLTGDWKVGIQSRNVANFVLDGGSINAVYHIALRDQSYAQISGTTFTPNLNVHAFERSHIHSFVPIDTARVISSYIVGMKEDGSVSCDGAFPAAMVGGSLENDVNLCGN
jgi:hypothetical protein